MDNDKKNWKIDYVIKMMQYFYIFGFIISGSVWLHLNVQARVHLPMKRYHCDWMAFARFPFKMKIKIQEKETKPPNRYVCVVSSSTSSIVWTRSRLQVISIFDSLI